MTATPDLSHGCLLWFGHLHIAQAGRSARGRPELAVLPQLGLGDVLAQPHGRPDQAKHDDAAQRDSKHVGRHEAALLAGVKEVVRVEAPGGLGDVRERQIHGQQDDQPEHVDRRRRVGARDEDLEQGEGAVQPVLRHVAPAAVHLGEPGAAVQAAPVDGGHDEGEDDDGRVEGRVQRLERAREPVEQGDARARVGEGVGCRGQVVEAEAPEGEAGEVAELVLRCRAVFVVVDALPDQDEDERGEDVERLPRRGSQ